MKFVSLRKTEWTPDPHVAIFVSDIDGNQGWFLGQNQGGHPDQMAGVLSTLWPSLIPLLYPTAFRPKGEPLPKEELKEIVTRSHGKP